MLFTENFRELWEILSCEIIFLRNKHAHTWQQHKVTQPLIFLSPLIWREVYYNFNMNDFLILTHFTWIS